MKRFMQNEGIFELDIPVSWHYRIVHEKVHTFENYEKGKTHAFQISLIDANDSKVASRFKQMTSDSILLKLKNKDVYCYPDRQYSNSISKTWLGFISGKIVPFTYTYPKTTSDDLPEEYNEVMTAIETFEIINKNDRQQKLNSYRFFMFLKGIAATNAILSNAVESKSFIEATCILANQIDALLRTGIVLKEQLLNRNTDVDDQWIYQGENDKRKSEKDIYKEAKRIGVINENVFNNLYKLYDDRNRVVHRFIISDIQLVDVEQIAFSYYCQCNEINKIIYRIEEEQIEKNIGMTQKGTTNDSEANLLHWVQEKIGAIDFFDGKNKQEN